MVAQGGDEKVDLAVAGAGFIAQAAHLEGSIARGHEAQCGHASSRSAKAEYAEGSSGARNVGTERAQSPRVPGRGRHGGLRGSRGARR